MGFFDKLKSGLSKTKNAIIGKIDNLFKSFRKVDEELFEELEELLISADIGVQTTEEILDELQGLRPDILFVGLGFPRQEEWIAKNTPSLPFLRLSMGLGGSLDVWSGEVKRAPDVFQKLGLEWLWRTLHSPSRLFRLPYLAAFFVKSTACSVKPAINQVKKLFPDF